MNTGGLILAVISAIFGIDAVIDFKYGQNDTISAWFYKWFASSWKAYAIYFSAFILLTLHFIFFK